MIMVEAQRRVEDNMTEGVGQWKQQQPLSGLMPHGKTQTICITEGGGITV